ncbi:hypothetical protein QT236_14480 [Geobacillus stearothermophilus]|nr:hypothetical protein QT236_12640 [Geobacillus stearothermophilus]WJQ03225.1 hypothetical protein QT236_14480 [Geobacillus stearothermophilus]
MVQTSFEVAMTHLKNGGKVYVEYNGKKREVVTPNRFVSFPVELMKKGLWFIE